MNVDTVYAAMCAEADRWVFDTTDGKPCAVRNAGGLPTRHPLTGPTMGAVQDAFNTVVGRAVAKVAIEACTGADLIGPRENAPLTIRLEGPAGRLCPLINFARDRLLNPFPVFGLEFCVQGWSLTFDGRPDSYVHAIELIPAPERTAT